MDQFESALPAGLGITKIHHVAVIVRDLDAALGLYRDKLGLTVETVLDMAYDHVKIGFLPVGEVKIELVQPTDNTTGSDSAVARGLTSTTGGRRSDAGRADRG